MDKLKIAEKLKKIGEGDIETQDMLPGELTEEGLKKHWPGIYEEAGDMAANKVLKEHPELYKDNQLTEEGALPKMDRVELQAKEERVKTPNPVGHRAAEEARCRRARARKDVKEEQPEEYEEKRGEEIESAKKYVVKKGLEPTEKSRDKMAWEDILETL